MIDATPNTSDEDSAETGETLQRDPEPQLEQFWETVRRIPRYVVLVTNLMRDSRVPVKAKAKLGLGSAYTVSPIDLVPGIIPVAGQLDDLVVLLVTLRHVVRSCDSEVAAEHLGRAGLTLDDFDRDLRVTRDTAVWLAGKGVRAAGKLTAQGVKRLRALWTSMRNSG